MYLGVATDEGRRRNLFSSNPRTACGVASLARCRHARMTPGAHARWDLARCAACADGDQRAAGWRCVGECPSWIARRARAPRRICSTTNARGRCVSRRTEHAQRRCRLLPVKGRGAARSAMPVDDRALLTLSCGWPWRERERRIGCARERDRSTSLRPRVAPLAATVRAHVVKRCAISTLRRTARPHRAVRWLRSCRVQARAANGRARRPRYALATRTSRLFV